VDPLFREYPFYSPYAFSGNEVISKIELEGLEPITIRINNNGDISYIELVSEETVEDVKNIYYKVINKLEGGSLKDGIEIEDGQVRHSSDALDRPTGNPTGKLSFQVDEKVLKKFGRYLGFGKEDLRIKKRHILKNRLYRPGLPSMHNDILDTAIFPEDKSKVQMKVKEFNEKKDIEFDSIYKEFLSEEKLKQQESNNVIEKTDDNGE
jgi:hypothetical protein